MISRLALEVGPSEAGAECECCGNQSVTAHGFVYKDGDAFAIYYAGWTPGHAKRGVSMAIATGEWTDGTGPADRVSIGLTAQSAEDEIQFRVVGPDESPWGDTPLFGRMLVREDALKHSRLRVTYEIAELVVREDPRVHAALF